MTLPALIPWQDVHARLLVIFPEGTPDRRHLIREATAKTIFTALYVGALAGADLWIAPRHVVRMSDAQAVLQGDDARALYYAMMSAAKAPSPEGRWYAENTREPLRDEVIRQGLVPINAMVERAGIATTSPLGRYALQADFAALFRPGLEDAALEAEAAEWCKRNLSPAALARAALVRASAGTSSANITVQCPGGPSIILPPGPSPTITKAVIEVFAPAFLGNPRVAWVSDSASKTPFRDAPLEKALGITLDAATLLPDVVLVDLDPPGRTGEVLLVFVEVVASDGPVTEQRRRALLDLIAASPRAYRPDDAAFVTA
ncbi:BsuBI/PstI family type II restriction endonuclease [Roseicella aquatilis]|uniref:BsuBI/PstI family type II restriction endonuclease n=1 Tax=Roseicella aquatilis TaxID=2527868 RepID=UPI001F0D1E35|nr:BsuBI/PstI family type II restriction endonuclease [Roseicella aquatilis]